MALTALEASKAKATVNADVGVCLLMMFSL